MQRSLSLSPRLALLLALVAFLLVPAFASAQVSEISGQTANGSFYRIQTPDGWTPADGLVIWNHGFDLNPPSLEELELGPLAGLHLSEGYAIAASSYSLNGWAVFNTVQDLELMVDVFEAEVGVPDEVFLYGASLGGLVTAQAIEEASLGNVVGALPICGAVAGSRVWDGAADIRAIYDFVCRNVEGGQIPGAGTGLTAYPFSPDGSLSPVGEAALEAQIACLGAPIPDAPRTAEQLARIAEIAELSNIPVEFVLTDISFALFGLSDLVFDPRKLGGGMPLTNIGIDYDSAEVNAEITRFAADPGDRAELQANYTPSGDIGDVKIVSIHTDKDGLVIVENESDYASKLPPSQFTLGIIVEDTPSHCGFTEAETVAAWESLRAWVAGAPQPSAASLQGTCQAIEGGGLAEGPCRIDPSYVVGSIDDRIRPREEVEACIDDADTLCLRDNRFAVEVTWTDFEGNTGSGLVIPQTSDTGSFYFFNPANIELVVKVLDGTPINGNYWVFYGSLTNVQFTMTVTDTETGAVATYENPLGNFASAGDVSAFPPIVF